LCEGNFQFVQMLVVVSTGTLDEDAASSGVFSVTCELQASSPISGEASGMVSGGEWNCESGAVKRGWGVGQSDGESFLYAFPEHWITHNKYVPIRAAKLDPVHGLDSVLFREIPGSPV
jgi:hypothetical protein